LFIPRVSTFAQQHARQADEHFVALAEVGQFTAAARRMNIVPSALSVTIKEFEEELGVPLTHRTTRTM
jgi:DNA-binding transcriptional LysR family regulator